MYTWGIFLAYICRQLSSRLHFHIFWEAGHDTYQDTLLPKHGEPTKVYTKRTSIVPPSSSVPVSTSQFGENTLPFDDFTLISVLSDSSSDISDINHLIALRKSKYTCTSHFLSNFVSNSHLTSSYSTFIFLWTRTQFSSLCQKPLLSQDKEMSCRKKWWL